MIQQFCKISSLANLVHLENLSKSGIIINMSETFQPADLTPDQEARLEDQAEKLGNYELARIRTELAPVRPSSPGQIAHAARLQARAKSHAETVERGQMDPAYELARMLSKARQHQSMQESPQTLDDDMFGDR